MSDEIVVQQNQTVLGMLNILANSKDVDATKIVTFYDLMIRERADQRQQEFNAAMVAVAAEAPKIVKNKVAKMSSRKEGVSSFSIPYADMESVYDGIMPILTAKGFALSFSEATDPRPGWIKMVVTIHHAGGHFETRDLSMPLDTQGAKSGPQGVGSTTTFLRRYLTLLAFNLISSDMPADRDGATEPEADAVDWRAEAAREFEIDNLTDAQKDFVFKWAGCTGFQDMTQAQARTIAEARRAKRASKRADAAAAAGKGGEHG